jgi:TonB family protein
MFERPPSRTRSTRSIFISLAIHAALVIGIFAVRYTVQSRLEPRRVLQVTLLSPTIAPARKHIAVRAPSKALEVQMAARLPAQKPPMLGPPLIEPPIVKTETVAPAIAEALPKSPSPPQPIAVLQTEVSMKAIPAAKVQIGGFESAATVAMQSDRARQSVAAGFGDAGTVPAPGARRGVATGAGFGDAGTAPIAGARRGVATGGGFGDAGVSSGTGSAQRSIRAGGFGDAVSAAPSSGGTRQMATAQPVTAAQILEKPRPVYSEEARRLQIEGEVQIEVQFRASGEVHIVRVVRGLGHGLDENAAQAARTIRFLPAKRDGLPVDSTATVHIIFQLAS